MFIGLGAGDVPSPSRKAVKKTKPINYQDIKRLMNKKKLKKQQ